ncbi:MAG: cyclic nucleotide-binding domain-containing protein [Leptospiraceae bacterium]|nr:cyclic nucleotide-binding domain-containing protein [Leptospiraceae bacterium]
MEPIQKPAAKNFLHIAANDIIFEENDDAKEMYIILSGKVGIHKKVKQSYKMLVELKEGDIFGEMALVDRKPRVARAVAITDVKLMPINEKALEKLIATNPIFAMKMVRMLSKRLRDADQTITNLLLGDKKGLVTSALITFAKQNGTELPGGIGIELNRFLKWAILRVGLETDDIQTALNLLQKDRLLEKDPTTNNKVILNSSILKYRME